jgi:hypothetical protein
MNKVASAKYQEDKEGKKGKKRTICPLGLLNRKITTDLLNSLCNLHDPYKEPEHLETPPMMT